jgi:hypothetical protein
MTTDTLTPDDVRAATAASAELGPAYDRATAEALLERLDRRPPSAIEAALTATIALGSIGLGVTFALVARELGDLGGTVATIVAWVAIAVVNGAHARARRRL